MNGHAIGLGLMTLDDWLHLNRSVPYDDKAKKQIAPFPPPELMQIVSGLTDPEHFALHGVAIFEALQQASPKPLTGFSSILDFGCGCGRLARMFKGYEGDLLGCDIDGRLVDWINSNLSYMSAVQTRPNEILPFRNEQFECIISISIFTHLDESTQDFYLAELARISKPGALLFLTIHGHRAAERAASEQRIFEMLSVSRHSLNSALLGMKKGTLSFILQQGHLTTETYNYGITFIPDKYIRRHWGEFFEIVQIVNGAIHDFQSIVVCRRR